MKRREFVATVLAALAMLVPFRKAGAQPIKELGSSVERVSRTLIDARVEEMAKFSAWNAERAQALSAKIMANFDAQAAREKERERLIDSLLTEEQRDQLSAWRHEWRVEDLRFSIDRANMAKS